MDQINWKIGSKVLKKFNDIWAILFTKEGKEIVKKDAEQSINGEHSILEEPYGKKYNSVKMPIFKKAYIDGYIEGFSRGFKEGAAAMEIEIEGDK